jgi:LysM repeat protein
VKIAGTGTSDLADRPDMFVANVGPKGNGCAVPEGTDVKFPNPGPVVQVLREDKLGAPQGTCGTSGPTSPAAGGPPADKDKATPSPPAQSSPPPAQGSPAPTQSSPAPTQSSPAPAQSSPAPAKDAPAPAQNAATPAPPASGSSGSGTTYTVKAGDICDTIAAKEGMTVAQLIKKNPSVYVHVSRSCPLSICIVNSFLILLAATPLAATSSLARRSTSAAAPVSCASTTERPRVTPDNNSVIPFTQ